MTHGSQLDELMRSLWCRALLPCCAQKQLELKRLEEQRKREMAKRTNWLAMTPKKRERFRQIRMWKKTEVAGLIQRWWRYLMGQKAYYEAVKKAQVSRLRVLLLLLFFPLPLLSACVRLVFVVAACSFCRWSGASMPQPTSRLLGVAMSFAEICTGRTTTLPCCSVSGAAGSRKRT
jgi:hypothetical protein